MRARPLCRAACSPVTQRRLQASLRWKFPTRDSLGQSVGCTRSAAQAVVASLDDALTHELAARASQMVGDVREQQITCSAMECAD